MTTATATRIIRPRGQAYLTHEKYIGRVHVWPHDQLSIEQVLALLARHRTWPTDRKANARARGVIAVLSWLRSFPGSGWQERWHAARADDNLDWIDGLIGDGEPWMTKTKSNVSSALRSLLLDRIILPGYGFLDRFKNAALFADIVETYSPEVFDRLEAVAGPMGIAQEQHRPARIALIKMVIRTGRNVDQLTPEDFYEYRAAVRSDRGAAPNGIHVAWELLAASGIFPNDSTLRTQLHIGQKSPEELVDRYSLQCRPIRDVLVRYLKERSPGLDYTSLRGIAAILANLFWADIERHHPGITSLNLPTEVADGWKERMTTIPTATGHRVRETYFAVMVQVRSFYLDLQEWATEDPSWVPWVAPSPVRRGETDGMSKAQRKATAVMHQRVRERLPLLPDLVNAIERHHTDTAALLGVATSVPKNGTFTHNGNSFQRVRSAEGLAPGADAVVVIDVLTGKASNLTRAEDEAFWVWAAVETLRHSGIRIEELLELTQLALVSYTLPGTGEVVPLLQIVPSKNNQERLLLISPELASVLATVITRLRHRNGGSVPLVARYDHYEATTGPALPHLFQRRHGSRRDVIIPGAIRVLLNEALARTGLVDLAGHPIRFTPHDFRRMFTTEAVSNGLPVHIAAKILGHSNINTTQSYLAIFQDDLIRTYRSFLDKRRAIRPAAEYREPTNQEWSEFQQHFELRKVSLGTCGRPYGTPCRHEHACIRCPVLRTDPRQRPRLVEIIRNLADRVAEARHNGWLGEVEGLQVSLTAATDKLATLDRSAGKAGEHSPTGLGIPTMRRQ